MVETTDISIERQDGRVLLRPSGEWTIQNAERIVRSLGKERPKKSEISEIDLSKVKALDTFGALQLAGVNGTEGGGLPKLSGATDAQRATFEMIQHAREKKQTEGPQRELTLPERLGRAAITFAGHIWGHISLLGEAASGLGAAVLKPSLIRPRELFSHLQLCSLDAVPIIGLVSFLIGIVVAYLFVSQAAQYGADVFIAEAVSIGMFREFSPILVAVIMAGRSGSAFTAQIGTMKMNEEIDAISALGLSPLHVIVVPRVLALVVAMPLLVFVGDLVGMGGGMLIAYNFLQLTPLNFLSRLHTRLCRRSFVIGLIKAPVFALLVATIGCKLGFSVEKNARSVGLHTTSSVVQSVVWVIIFDALFAVVLQKLKL